MDFSHFLAQRVFWGALSHEIIISFTTQLQIKFFCSFVQNFQDPGNPGKKSSFIQIFFQDFQNPGNFKLLIEKSKLVWMIVNRTSSTVFSKEESCTTTNKRPRLNWHAWAVSSAPNECPISKDSQKQTAV